MSYIAIAVHGSSRLAGLGQVKPYVAGVSACFGKSSAPEIFGADVLKNVALYTHVWSVRIDEHVAIYTGLLLETGSAAVAQSPPCVR